jgi:hypothetical protein
MGGHCGYLPQAPKKPSFATAIRNEVIFDSRVKIIIQDRVLLEKMIAAPSVNKFPVSYAFLRCVLILSIHLCLDQATSSIQVFRLKFCYEIYRLFYACYIPVTTDEEYKLCTSNSFLSCDVTVADSVLTFGLRNGVMYRTHREYVAICIP